MRNWKEFIKKILFPPVGLIIACSILSIFALIYSFTDNAFPIIQYISYAFSAYSLTIVCCRIPDVVKWADAFRKNNAYIVRYQTDLQLRTKIALYANVSLNFLFAVFHLVSGIVYHSGWSYSLAGYYSLLSVMRFFLLRDVKGELDNNVSSQWKRYRFCGILLIVMNVALAGIVFLIVYQNKGFSYHYIYTIGMAAFTFLMTSLAIKNFISYRKHQYPLISAVKYISMASALVSMLSLETALINAFGSEDEEVFRVIMTAITGGVICVIVLAIGVYMVIRSTKQLKNCEINQPMEEERLGN